MNQPRGDEQIRPFGCYNQEELAAIRSRVQRTPALMKEYSRQQKLAEQFTADELSAPLEALGAFRVDPFVFETPPGTAYVRLRVHIQGAGEARIGGIKLSHSQQGLPVVLQGASFEQGLAGWVLEADTQAEVQLLPLTAGLAALQPSGATPPASGGEAPAAQCLLIRHPAEAADTLLHFGAAVPARAGEHYAVQTALSLAAPLSGGIRAGVTFLNEAEQPLGDVLYSPLFNRPTPTNWSYLLEAAGADANVYMISGDRSCAERCVRKLAYMLADMRQGMDLFKRDGWHDDDTYGAVHIGRGLAITSVIYDQIAASGQLNPEEQALILENFRYIAAMMMDTGYYRYDLTQFPDEKGGKRSNWNADRATGLGVYALLFPQEAQAAEYLKHARSVIEWQLEHVVDGDGAWPENIRYHGAVLHRYFLFFALLKRLQGVDYFQHVKVKGMYRFLIGTAVTHDRIQGGASTPPRLLTPAVGDANVHELWFRLLAYAAPFYSGPDPQLTGEMTWTWRRGGEPIQDTGAYPCPLVALLYPRDDLPEIEPEIRSAYYPEVGYVIFRSGQDQPEHAYYAIYEASPLTYHAHHDEGQFSIWADSVPLTLDSGTGGYYNGDRHWFVSGAAHNVVQFVDGDGRLRDGPLCSSCEEVFFSEELDYTRSWIPDEYAADYRRHFVFIKAGFSLYLVWDQIRSTAASVWNLHTLSTSAEVEAQSITAHCLGGMRLNALIAEPSGAVITTGDGAVGGAYPLAAQQHFRIHGGPGSDYLVLLHPQGEGSPGVELARLDDGRNEAGIRLYKVSQQRGGWFIVAVNGSARAQQTSLAGLGPLRSLGGRGQIVAADPGKETLIIEAGMLYVLVPR
ncbi:heparinase II/III family protein [Paenibacillus albidus]|uniref:heparinase II/III domain-containing protein n=1 Tax=Paenibacillus albidus TaxID=2041023 RepID=UPI001BE8F05A|nr:heparinase II/III family protein [Paenibacillus albidus]MBT2291330.1 heparinase II/III family protein [Paenibacillus albidus]